MIRIILDGIIYMDSQEYYMGNVCTHRIINDVKLFSPTGNPFGEETGIMPVRLFFPMRAQRHLIGNLECKEFSRPTGSSSDI